MRTALLATLAAATLCYVPTARAQYNPTAGTSAPVEKREVETRDEQGHIERKVVEHRPGMDTFGNAAGTKYDLAVDGAFKGQTIAVMQLYVEAQFDFSLPKAALEEKGFSVYRWIGNAPSPEELERALEKSCQFWLISDGTRKLNEGHLRVIKKFFESGKGVYIWGDNDPYYADANFVAEALFGAKMLGDLMGDQPVGLQQTQGKHGLKPNHLLTTGLEHIYEGITIATIQPSKTLSPLIYGSADNLVTAVYEHNGKRAILDGGFTRLYIKWDTAGTARYVKNAAAWLVNYERFGKAVTTGAGR